MALVQFYPATQPLPLTVQGIPKPPCILGGGPVQPEAPDLHRRHIQMSQLSSDGIHAHEVQQRQVVPILFVAADTLVVVQKIPAAVECGSI